MTYEHVGEAIADARRLAEAMTLKKAAADLPMGGGKSVLALPQPRQRLSKETWSRILQLHSANLELLNGSYSTGPDVGTSSADMDVLGRATKHVFGRSPAAGGAGSSAEATARGVHASIRAALAEAGCTSIAGVTILVQGLGAVGARLCELLFEAGAHLLVSDVDPGRCAAAVARGAVAISPDVITRTACDVLSPCATGGLIDSQTARALLVAAAPGQRPTCWPTPTPHGFCPSVGSSTHPTSSPARGARSTSSAVKCSVGQPKSFQTEPMRSRAPWLLSMPTHGRAASPPSRPQSTSHAHAWRLPDGSSAPPRGRHDPAGPSQAVGRA